MRFADVIGQQVVKERFLAMVAEERVPHAMLFLGTEGSGALPLAMAFAQYLDCTGDKSGGDSCGQCPSCRKLAKLVHPDVHYVFPMIKMGQKDDADGYLPEWRNMVTTKPYFSLSEWTSAMSSKKGEGADADAVDDKSAPTGKQALIPKDAAAAIHAKLSMKPYEAQKQILILWKPELMNEATSNSLLKILEEPPTDTVFFLVSEDTTSILPTILSRTQVFKVPPISDEDLIRAVTEKLGIFGEKAKRLAHNAQGNFVTAQRLVASSDDMRTNLNLFKSIMRDAWKRDVVGMNGNADVFRGMTREQVKSALIYFQRMVRESFIMNLGHAELNYLSEEEYEFLVNFAPFVHVGNVEKLSALMDDTLAMVSQNGNIKMVMKSMILQLTALIRKSQRPKSSE